MNHCVSVRSQHRICCQKPEVVSEYLIKECVQGRVMGPLDPAQFLMVQTSHFGVIIKGSSGKGCFIVDLSSPEEHSVNDGIDSGLCSLMYVTVDDAVAAVQQIGPGAQLAKADIRSAYCIISVHPEDWWLLGMSWEGALYVDTVLRQKILWVLIRQSFPPPKFCAIRY